MRNPHDKAPDLIASSGEVGGIFSLHAQVIIRGFRFELSFYDGE